MLSQVCCWYTTHGHAHAAFYGTPLIIPHPDHSSLVCPGVTLLPIMVPSFLLDFGDPLIPARGDRKRPKKGGVRLERPPSTTSQHLWSTPSRGDRHERRVRAPGTTSAPLCQWERACKKRARLGVKGGRRRKKRPTKNSLIKPAIGTPVAPPAGRRRGSARSSSTAGTRAARLQPSGTSVSSLGDWPTRAWPAGSGCAPSSQPILSSTSATTYREARALAQDCDLLSP